MENTEESVVVPYVTTAARLAFDAMVEAFQLIRPEGSTNSFLTDMFRLALKDPSISHDGQKDRQIRQLGRAYLLDHVNERIFTIDDVIQELAETLTGDEPDRPKKKSNCCRSDWFQVLMRSGVQMADSLGVPRRLFVQAWGKLFVAKAEQHTEGRGPLVGRFREVFKVICGTPDLIDLMNLLKRDKKPIQELIQEAEDAFAEAEDLLSDLGPAEPAPEVQTPEEDLTLTVLDNPYDFDWGMFKEAVKSWPRVVVIGPKVFFIARTYLDEKHRRVYEGGHVFIHRDGHRYRESIHDLPFIMQVKETGGRFEMKYTVTALDAPEAIGKCGKFWKNTDGQGDEVALYRWFVITRDPKVPQTPLPMLHPATQAQFNRFSEARLEDSRKSTG